MNEERLQASDLMVGDLMKVAKDVFFEKGTIVRILCIDGTSDFPLKGLKGCAVCLRENDPDTTIGGVWVDYLEPIPITPEILEKNGFAVEGYKYVLKYDHYVEVWVIFSTSDERHSVIHHSVIHIDDDRERIPTAYHNTIKYVHELQHALKLCRIDKKIEL